MNTHELRRARAAPAMDQLPVLTTQPQSGKILAMTNPCGALALGYCAIRLPLQVLESGAGFYIGTTDAAGPVSRESEEYFATRAAAVQALRAGRWTRRHQP